MNFAGVDPERDCSAHAISRKGTFHGASGKLLSGPFQNIQPSVPGQPDAWPLKTTPQPLPPQTTAEAALPCLGADIARAGWTERTTLSEFNSVHSVNSVPVPNSAAGQERNSVTASGQTFSPVRGSSSRSTSDGRADRCRAWRSGANLRPDSRVRGPAAGRWP